jgi:hypothetical protein
MNAICTLTAAALSTVSLGVLAGEGPADFPPVRTEPAFATPSRADVVTAIGPALSFDEGRYPGWAGTADERPHAVAVRADPAPLDAQPLLGDFSSPFAAGYAA